MNKKIVENKERYIGQMFETKRCGVCTVIDYRGNKDVLVKFEDPECVVKTQLGHLKIGNVFNPTKPSVHNLGFIGIGRYDSYKNKGAYSAWCRVFERCYGKTYLDKFPTYRDVTVCEEWYNFQNFAEWFYSQEHSESLDEGGKLYQLDKDILVKGNKIYSPETCCFVPACINGLFISSKVSTKKSGLPIGVGRNKRGSVLVARINLGKLGNCKLGSFYSVEEAFQVYKKAKEVYIKETAEYWKDRIDNRVYRALINYEI